MKKVIKNSLCIILSAIMCVSLPVCALAVSRQDTYYEGFNVNKQNYYYQITYRSSSNDKTTVSYDIGFGDRAYSSNPITSYFVNTDDGGYMRFQSDALICTNENAYLVEYYNNNFDLLNTVKVTKELPIFGAFYNYGDYYYILSGQTNYEEDNSKEVFRLTKFSKQWQRITSVSLYGANTIVPFCGGSARMDCDGSRLIIRTSHKMYTSRDGKNHQANVTMLVDVDSMDMIGSSYNISYIKTSYVSHSFNQFTKIDDGYIVNVDHGDAYPRSVVITKSVMKCSSDYPTDYDYNKLFDIKGEIGDNYTGVEVGGFEISDSKYIIVGNSIDMNGSNEIKNIFISTVDKNLQSTETKFITGYTDESASNAQLVKIDNNKFVVFWMKSNDLNYIMIDGNGNFIDYLHTVDGKLSDCQPIVSGSDIVWYTWDNKINTFYTVDINNLSNFNKYESVNGLVETTTQATTATKKTTKIPEKISEKQKKAKFKKAIGSKKAVALTWSKVKGVKGYQIQVSTDKKFKKNVKSKTVNKQKTTKTTVKKLKSKTKYYVRIRTYKVSKGTKVYSSWSKAKTVKTK